MKKLLLLLIVPFLSYSQTISVSGSSYLSKIQNIDYFSDDIYLTSLKTARTSTVSLDISQGVRLPIGFYGFGVGVDYTLIDADYDFTSTHPEIDNYNELTEIIRPNIYFSYYLLSTDNLRISTSIGTYITLQELSFSNTDFEYDIRDSIEPFARASASVSIGSFWVTPFVQYLIDPIYFYDFSEISESQFNEAIDGGGLVSGVSLGFKLR